jgi:regulator of sirC expression with transglutaminase-like and TPR domain
MMPLRRLTICAVVLIGATALASQTGDSPFPPSLSINPFAGSDPYQDCVNAIAKKPDDAFEMALAWRDHGGGVQAEHCAALALINLDEPGEAASRLNALAQRQNAGTAAERSALLGQAGNAWLLANQPENAEAAFSAALRLSAQDAEMWVDRARARAARQDWANAEADLNTAIGLNKGKADFFVLRASARHAQGNMDGYKSDIDSALAIDPTYPDALVERGALKVQSGDAAGARADWLQVLLRAPDSPAAESVRRQIETLEVHDR